MDSHHPKFFLLQSERLSALLDVIVMEASAATDPDACVDYLELTEILVDLLNQAQLYSILTPDEIDSRQYEANTLIGRIKTVQEAVGDWDSRMRARASVQPKKRPWSNDFEPETAMAPKRPKGSESEQEVAEDAVFSLQYGGGMPSIETTHAPW